MATLAESRKAPPYRGGIRSPRTIVGVKRLLSLRASITRAVAGLRRGVLIGVVVAFITLLAGLMPPSPTLTLAASTYPRGWVDDPVEGADISGSTITIDGWAIDVGAASGTGVDRVEIVVDGKPLGEAVYARSRPDIGAAFGDDRFTESGFLFLLQVDALGGGTHQIEMRAHSTVSDALTAYDRTVVVPAASAPTAATVDAVVATAVLPPVSLPALPTQLPSVQAGTPAPVAAATPPPVGAKRFGVNSHLTWYDSPRASRDVERVRATGLQAMRFDVQWDSLEPTHKGEFDPHYLTQVDTAMDLIARSGLQPLVILIGTPAWARDAVGSARTPPTHVEDYAATLAMLAQRYAGYPGLAMEVWNEPNQREFWDTPAGPDPLTYARMLKVAYASIKAVAPGTTVLGGSIAFNDDAYLEGLFTFGGIAGAYDALALHPYTQGFAPDAADAGYYSFRSAVEHAAQVMAQYGDAGRPIWITEIGWSTDLVTDDVRAEYFRRAVDMVRAWPQVTELIAFDQNQADGHPDVGLVTPQGTPTSSWLAYVQAASPRATETEPLAQR